MHLHKDTSSRPLLAIRSDCHLQTGSPSSEEMSFPPGGLRGALDGVEAVISCIGPEKNYRLERSYQSALPVFHKQRFGRGVSPGFRPFRENWGDDRGALASSARRDGGAAHALTSSGVAHSRDKRVAFHAAQL
jgi:hypothetical protein